MKRATEEELNTYVVIVGKEVVFECRSQLQGYAYIAGRGEGVLAGVLQKCCALNARTGVAIKGRKPRKQARKRS